MTSVPLHSALRRVSLVALMLGAWLHGAAVAAQGWDSVVPGTIVLFRHAVAPGGGDPPNHTLDDCSTQRNLSDEGRTQARRIGAEFKQRRIEVGAVWTSPRLKRQPLRCALDCRQRDSNWVQSCSR
jgi:hypothetical protein